MRHVRTIAINDYYLCQVCMSVCPHGTASFHWMDFHEILYLSICQKSVLKMQGLLKSEKNNGYIT